jgi:hypothetical protein
VSFWGSIKKYAPRVLTLGLVVLLQKGDKTKPRDLVNAVVDELLAELGSLPNPSEVRTRLIQKGVRPDRAIAIEIAKALNRRR